MIQANLYWKKYPGGFKKILGGCDMLKQAGNKVYRRFDKELLCIQPWGKNSFRVQATQRHEFVEDEDISALLLPEEVSVKVYERGTDTVIENGKITCEITRTGKLRFLNQDGKLLLEEYERIRGMEEEGRKEFNSALEIVPRTFEPRQSTDNYRLTVRFEPIEGEKLYGMGQYQQPYLDVKGCTLELAHRNSQASIPFVLSSNGYGFLWNNPSIGAVTFGKNVTQWTAQSTKQMDYWITAGDTPAEIEEAYADATGKVPMMPEYGMGFWQCKLRYMTQEEILEVAREYHRRKLPVDVIVVDFFHWPHEGDWKFDLDYWPDPEKMVRELKEMGMHLMVSIWPTVDGESENYKIKKNYYEKGIHIFWLDEAEPEFTGYEFSHYRYFRGADMEVGNIYPREYARMAYEGMEKEGQKNILNLLRCAWAGSQRYGTLVWSGDIDSSFRSLRNQLAAGLNMGISGIPWWTTDIGGFHGGNIYDPKFHELLVRWFEFGAFCPVMRLHGYREPFKAPLGTTGGGKHNSGAENEVWSYGEEVYKICEKYIHLRERMRPYVRQIMEEAHEKGTPAMRPLFYDFPEDKKAWDIEDEYMFGPDLLVAPVLYEEQRERTLYLPEGLWRNINDGQEYEGGREITVSAPLDQLPVFAKAGKLTEL